MINRIQKKDCCGCRACANICPSHCVTFQRDQEGFDYPKIDEEKCIACGLCEKVCPFLDTVTVDKPANIEVYGAWNTDEKVRFSSSSGGVFTALAEYVIKQGGVVFGAGIGKDGQILHSGTDSWEEIKQFRKSKYVQSNTGGTFQEAKEYLEQGRLVLFSGVPCQIMALHKFLGKEYEQLYSVDVICAGVSSPGVWESYIEQIEREHGSKVTDIIFRHKDIDNTVLKGNNRNLTIKLFFENGTSLYQFHNKNEFFDGFLNKLFLRPSCADCKAKKFRSKSDIQLGDFWEIEKIYPEVLDLTEDKKRIPFGISEVFVYTEKGRKLFNAVNEEIISFPADLVLVKEVQGNTNWHLITSSAQPHWNRGLFFKDYQKNPKHVNEAIAYHLDRNNMKILSGKKIGIWGSFRLRETVRVIGWFTDCKLDFQFRNSTIYSIMSETNPDIEYLFPSSNTFRSQMLKNDIEKEFRIHMKSYAQNVDFLILDLLEERYANMMCGETVVTKSEGYYESVGIRGMPLAVSFDMWKEAVQKFMELLQKYFAVSRIIVIENYLCHEYGDFRSSKSAFKNQEYIEAVNLMLSKKYRHIQEQWPEIAMMPKLPKEFCFTEMNHSYGCIPEHMNHTAYFYMAQQICDIVAKKRKIVEI